MIRLLLLSIIKPYFIFPLKIIVLFARSLFFLSRWTAFFDYYEKLKSNNHPVFWKTLYFNLRSLPLNQAYKFPIHIFTNVQIISSSGRIIIDSPIIYSGMIRWGWFYSYRSQGKTRINNQGTIIFKGGGKLLQGSEIMVKGESILTIGSEFFIGENTMIYCWDKVTIGNHTRLTYHSQIFDSDFHYSINTETGEVHKRSKAVVLGDYNWIGNRTTIKKGVKTPNHITVAGSNSLLTSDYTKSIPEYSVIGGIPAKLIVSKTSRIWNNEFSRIKEIDDWFHDNPKEKLFKYNLDCHDITDFTEDE